MQGRSHGPRINTAQPTRVAAANPRLEKTVPATRTASVTNASQNVFIRGRSLEGVNNIEGELSNSSMRTGSSQHCLLGCSSQIVSAGPLAPIGVHNVVFLYCVLTKHDDFISGVKPVENLN